MNRRGWISLTDRNYIPTVVSLVSHPLHCWGVCIPLFYKALGKISLPGQAEVWDHSLERPSSQGQCFVFAFGLLSISHLLLYWRRQERVTEGKKSGEQLKRHEARVPLNIPYWREDCLLICFQFFKMKRKDSGIHYSKVSLSSKLDLDTLELPGTEVTASHHQTSKCSISVTKTAKDHSEKHLPGRD